MGWVPLFWATGGKWKSLHILCTTCPQHHACFIVNQAILEIPHTQWNQVYIYAHMCTHDSQYDCVYMINRLDMLAVYLCVEQLLQTHIC